MPSYYSPLSPSKMLIITGAFLLITAGCNGQQQAQFTQYMFNGLVINPAYAGADGALSITALTRSQWVGVDGAPVTQTLTAHAPAGSHTGLGLAIINDKIGIHKNLTLNASYSYRLLITKTSWLSMGLQTGIDNNKSDYASLTTKPGDPNQFQNSSSTFFNFGAGMYFNSSRLQIGFSIPNMIPGKVSLQDTVGINLNPLHCFLFSRYRITVNQSVKLEPAFLIKYVANNPFSFDLNVNMIVHDVFTAGLSYRKSESLDFLCKLKLTPQLSSGFAYDFPIGKTTSLRSSGTYELMVNYAFKFNHKSVSPR